MSKKTRNFLCMILLLAILFPHVTIPTHQTYDYIEHEKKC